jgi:quercetin dioxygenase-like cupin family protein
MKWTRRQLATFFPTWAACQASAQTSGALPSAALKFEDFKVRDNGKSKSRAVLDGHIHSGFPVEMHITELNPGESPHPPHQHVNEEAMFLQKGRLDATVNGTTTRLTAGSVFYVYSNDLHGIHNPGPEPAQYFVVALGAKA